MNHRPASASWERPALSALLVSMALGLAACATTAPGFETPDASFKGRVSVVDTPQVVPGGEVTLAGRDFTPGQRVQLMYGSTVLNGHPAVVGQDGSFRATFTVPAASATGQHPLVVSASQPAAALVLPLKVSPDVPLSGQDRFEARASKLVPGLYQSAYSAKTDRVFVTSAVGRPPITQSELLKVHPQTLAIEARATPPQAPAQAPQAGSPAPREPGLLAVYGVGVDDANGTVWVTNTRQNTVAVYRQADLKLLKQFAPGTVPHARDVVVDEKLGKAYASPVAGHLAVFDTKTLSFVRNIPIATTVAARPGPGGGEPPAFAAMSLALDADNHRLFTVSLGTDEAAIIDTRTDAVVKVFALEGAKTASGVAYDARTGRLLVASQGSDNLLIVDADSGKTLHDVKVGAGALNVVLDPVSRLAYVANRGGGTVTVVDIEQGRIVANLDGGTYPNHVAVDGKGNVYAVNKSRGADDAQGDRITLIRPR